VLVCRGCCCGNPLKHPTTDHLSQLHQIRDAADATASVSLRVVGCLGECSSSNVVVLRSRGHGRAVWIPHVLDDERTTAVVEWIGHGGPGNAEAPACLAGTTFHHHAPRNTRPPNTLATPELP
jgi:hypothetical protein